MTFNQWIIQGETGVSSKTIWAGLTESGASKYKAGPYDVPGDVWDLRRCLLLMKQCNVPTEDLQKVVAAFPWWKPFVDNWEKLKSLYNREYDANGFRIANRYHCSELIQELEIESRLLGGWKQTGPSSWKLVRDDGSKIESVSLGNGVTISVD